MRVGYLASGEGHLIATLAQAIADEAIPGASNAGLAADRNCRSLEVARQFDMPAAVFPYARDVEREAYFERILTFMRSIDADTLFLTFRRILPPSFIARFGGPILNVHPSLLPAFPGLSGTEEGVAYGCRFLGSTLHFVDETLDLGPVLVQCITPVGPDEDPALIRHRLYGLERQMIVNGMHIVASGQYRLDGRRVHVADADVDAWPVNPLARDARLREYLRTLQPQTAHA